MCQLEIMQRYLDNDPKYQSKEGKDHEYNQVPHLTQTPYGKVTRKNPTHESQGVSPFPAGDHKAARNRLDSIIKTNMKHR